ncbi:MAG TPA: hypothetical protein VGO66_07985 [Solirubrobacterales bacterium]|jgi:hypothetical protein|nr:hypothetical protein [Solirubrobacterales bacterium]
MRLASALAIIALAAAMAGCDSSSDEGTQTNPGPAAQPPRASGAEAPVGAAAKSCDTHAVDAKALRVTAVSCGEGRRVMFAWQRAESCGLIDGASRGSCAVRSYRCLAARTDRGISVSCARPGHSVAFIAKRG